MKKFLQSLRAKCVAFGVAMPMAFGVINSGCTDLDTTPYSLITPDQFFKNDDEFLAAMAPVYAQLRALQWNYHNIEQHSTDETMVPQRGGDWGDGDRWKQLHRHTWDKTHSDLNGAWADAYTGVARANSLLEALDKSTLASAATYKAEVRTLRAFYYYTLLDMFGGVPIIKTSTVDNANLPKRNTAAEVFAFIETELKDAAAVLPTTKVHGRVNKYAAQALLVRVYLNAQFLTGTVSSTGLTTGAARWADVTTNADAIINSGQYGLESDYFASFLPENHASKENIFVSANLQRAGFSNGLSFNQRQLHYNQTLPQGAWNGFTTLAETFNKFSDADYRKNQFLIGQQCTGYVKANADGSCPAGTTKVLDRNGNPLIFTSTVANFDAANEAEGIRVLKWGVDNGAVDGNSKNDYAWVRYADILLAKAEALNETAATNTATAAALVNQIRTRAKLPALTAAQTASQAALRDAIFAERGYEFVMEAVRRIDLIRANKYWQGAWQFKEKKDGFRILYPIPQPAIDANPNLTQNAGY
jgi:hypothetical protein